MNLLGALLKDLTLYLSLRKNVVITVISDKEEKRWQPATVTPITDAHTERRVVQLKVDTCEKGGRGTS